MPWQGTRREQDHIDANVVAGLREPLHQQLRGCRDAHQARFVDRVIKLRDGLAHLDLDERNQPGAARDQIDLASLGFDAGGEDFPSAPLQPRGGIGLPAPALRIGGLAGEGGARHGVEMPRAHASRNRFGQWKSWIDNCGVPPLPMWVWYRLTAMPI